MALTERIRPRRRIDAISAVLLPYDEAGRPDMDAFTLLLQRTHSAGLQPAVNMDTGFGPHLGPALRRRIVDETRAILGPGVPFVAGLMPFGEDDEGVAGYRSGLEVVSAAGATPIVYPSPLLAAATGPQIVDLHREILHGGPRALAFELGPMFAAFGRIYDIDTVRGLLAIPQLVGIKHSSLSRSAELQRLELRDRERPEFRIYTGNDLAIDMVMYGSDYLLGLSTFDPQAFALRDTLWEAGDDAFFDLNDALQAVGHVAFRDPVPAYRHSAAVYLNLTGQAEGVYPHPGTPRRPEWEAELLEPFARRVSDAVARAGV